MLYGTTTWKSGLTEKGIPLAPPEATNHWWKEWSPAKSGSFGARTFTAAVPKASATARKWKKPLDALSIHVKERFLPIPPDWRSTGIVCPSQVEFENVRKRKLAVAGRDPSERDGPIGAPEGGLARVPDPRHVGAVEAPVAEDVGVRDDRPPDLAVREGDGLRSRAEALFQEELDHRLGERRRAPRPDRRPAREED